jgi:hypothetical protein
MRNLRWIAIAVAVSCSSKSTPEPKADESAKPVPGPEQPAKPPPPAAAPTPEPAKQPDATATSFASPEEAIDKLAKDECGGGKCAIKTLQSFTLTDASTLEIREVNGNWWVFRKASDRWSAARDVVPTPGCGAGKCMSYELDKATIHQEADGATVTANVRRVTTYNESKQKPKTEKDKLLFNCTFKPTFGCAETSTD